MRSNRTGRTTRKREAPMGLGIWKEGDKSKALCDTCNKAVTTTFRNGSVTVPGTTTKVSNVLLGFCDGCGALVSIPHQSVPKIKEHSIGAR